MRAIQLASAAALVLGVLSLSGCKGGGASVARAPSSNSSRTAQNGEFPGAPRAPTSRSEATAQAGRTELAYRTTPAGETGAPRKPQITCPVSRKPLGVGNSPIVTIVKREPVFVCSQGCVKKVQANPDQYLARVRAEVARAE